MHVVVVVESMFGNTYSVGEAIAAGLRSGHPSVSADLVRTTEVALEQVSGADLLVVGAPTHWFGVPSQRTQHQYLKDSDLAAGRSRAGNPLDPSAAGVRVRDWLATLPRVVSARAAAFDTRLARPLSGGAAPRIARTLSSRGYMITCNPMGFIVTGMEGPLRAGEVDRAREWGKDLLESFRS